MHIKITCLFWAASRVTVDRITLFYGEKVVCILSVKCELGYSLCSSVAFWWFPVTSWAVSAQGHWGRTFIHSNKSSSVSQWMFELATASETEGVCSMLPVSFCISLRCLPQLEMTVFYIHTLPSVQISILLRHRMSVLMGIYKLVLLEAKEKGSCFSQGEKWIKCN